ncbi:MAG: hypothetical protein WBA10_16300 [Elainellaceae cyanobacterium]
MEIGLHKWGDSIGFRIPHQIAVSLGFDEHSVVEVTAAGDALVIRKKRLALDDLLNSIPEDFQYPDDVQYFVGSDPAGQEVI